MSSTSSGSSSRGADAVGVLYGAATDLHLHAGESLLADSAGVFAESVLAELDPAAVGLVGGDVLLRAAEQVVQRPAGLLPLGVPQRRVDGGDGEFADPFAADERRLGA
ncbi:hypothetical protein ACFQL0_15785 [Haloplanus litoreus]|uniref:hypothetical protein n=1 Tax=Haloplanus litoreus TaxID=767515 RepID=UPI00361843C0